MKKFFTTLLMLAALVGMNAQENVNVWILGNVGDQGWDPSVGTLMEYVGDDTYEYEGHFKSSSYFSFTTMLGATSSDWDIIRPYRFGATFNDFSVEDLLGEAIACGEYGESADNAFLIVKGGNYKITLILEEDNRLVMIEREEEDPEVPPTPGGIFILGQVNGNGWEPSQGVAMDSIANNTFSATVNVTDSAAYFGFTRALATTLGNWVSIAEYRFAAPDSASAYVELGKAMPVSADGEFGFSFTIEPGYYTFTLDLNARTLTVVEAVKEDAMYIIGNNPFGDWDPANPMKMAKNGNVYTAEATINGDVWFIFSDDFGSWDAVNARRFGPESTEEDQVINPDEDVTTQLSTGGKSYKITGNGDYVITFDKEKLTFKFASKSAIRGDLTGEGVVDVDDLNVLINIMLNKADMIPAADLTGDGIADVDDLNALINIMLGKE